MEISKSAYAKAFIISFSFTIIGVLLKINHIGNATIILAIGLILTLIYIIIGIKEVNSSTKLQSSDKVLWTIGFLFFNFFVGIFYLIKRKNIVQKISCNLITFLSNVTFVFVNFWHFGNSTITCLKANHVSRNVHFCVGKLSSKPNR